jgi:hypothetical protein
MNISTLHNFSSLVKIPSAWWFSVTNSAAGGGSFPNGQA